MRRRSVMGHEEFRRVGLLVIVALSGWLAACERSSTPAAGTSKETRAVGTSGELRSAGMSGVAPAALEPWVPELGEIMSLQQMRHTKLWLAGQAKNWDLAAYEVKELREGFDAVIKYHPTHDDSPVAPSDAIPRMMTEPLKELAAIVVRKDSQAFTEAYDAVTSACNSCHQATNVGFNRLQRPTMNPYPDQVFSPPPQ
jgi:hypothetical protein